jgi:GH25 family lysozyme M1 (1,4-beta-N-acetylmuramidase)
MNNKGYGSLTKLYTYTSYANTALNTPYMRNQIDWIAQYYHYVTYTGSYRMWQYSSTEYIPGIQGGTDVSVLFR